MEQLEQIAKKLNRLDELEKKMPIDEKKIKELESQLEAANHRLRDLESKSKVDDARIALLLIKQRRKGRGGKYMLR